MVTNRPMSEAVKGDSGTFWVGALAGRGAWEGEAVVVSWKSGLVTNTDRVGLVGGCGVVLAGLGLLRGGPNLLSRAATLGGIFGCGGGPRLAKEGLPFRRFLGFSTSGGPNLCIRACTSGGSLRLGAGVPVGVFILLGASVGGLAIGPTSVAISLLMAGVGVVREKPRPLLLTLCLCLGWILLFWKLLAGGKLPGATVPCIALLATKRCRLEIGSWVVVMPDPTPDLISRGSAVVDTGLVSIRLLRSALEASSPPLCFLPCRTFSQSLRLSLTCFLRLITRDFRGFQKFRFLAFILDLTRGLLPPAVLVGGQWKGLKHLPASSSISLLTSAIVLNLVPDGIFCRREPPLFVCWLLGLSRKRLGRVFCLPPPCDCCANWLAFTRGLPEGRLPNLFLFLGSDGDGGLNEGGWREDRMRGGEVGCGVGTVVRKLNLFEDCGGLGTAGCGVAVKVGRGVGEGKD